MAAEEREEHELNRDPITEEPGSHPLGTGVGATGGAIAGAAAGSLAGPVGAALGGAVGAVVGGLAGKAAAEAVNPTAEDAFWRENFDKAPYYRGGHTFDDYGPAYRLGLTGRMSDEDPWTNVEPRLASAWDDRRDGSRLDWSDARMASQAAWQRADDQISSYRQLHADDSPGGGAAAAVGAMQSAGDASGDRADVIDAIRDLVECSKDGEYGFRECAQQVKRPDLKSTFLQRADDCRQAALELNQLIRDCGGQPEEGGSAMGAMHRGWVSIKSKLTAYDDKAVLAECERGEDNAKARYLKALQKNLPANVR